MWPDHALCAKFLELWWVPVSGVLWILHMDQTLPQAEIRIVQITLRRNRSGSAEMNEGLPNSEFKIQIAIFKPHQLESPSFYYPFPQWHITTYTLGISKNQQITSPMDTHWPPLHIMKPSPPPWNTTKNPPTAKNMTQKITECIIYHRDRTDQDLILRQ